MHGSWIPRAVRSCRTPFRPRAAATPLPHIGHWDVTDMRDVLPEAWELVDDGLLDLAQFRDFTCGNAVRMLTAAAPDFFKGTVLEGITAAPV